LLSVREGHTVGSASKVPALKEAEARNPGSDESEAERCGTAAIVRGQGHLPLSDPAQLKSVASARRRFDKITSGGAASSAEIARREGLQKGYVAHLTRLEFFSPTVVEMLLSTPAAG